MNSSSITSPHHITTYLLIGVFSFVGAWKMSGSIISHQLRNVSEDSLIYSISTQIKGEVCNQMGSHPLCMTQGNVSPPAHKADPPTHSENSHNNYRELFASMPNTSTALSQLQWNDSDEAEAARLMSIIKSIISGRYYEKKRDAQARLSSLIRQVWQAHPLLVAASVCIYCGDISRIIKRETASAPLSPDLALTLAQSHPNYLQIIGKNGSITEEQALRIASIQSALYSPGDAQTAQYIAQLLIDQQRHDDLLAWLTKGLNGGKSLENFQDLDSLPQSILIGAWERGAGMAYDSAKLTAYLVGQGYRPALRWLVWLLDGGTTYISTDNYAFKINQSVYHAALTRHTEFHEHKGSALSDFYSNNWQDIIWDSNRNIWRLR